MSITYQQAKRIRKTGLMSLFADQLMYEKKVTTAIKKTISLKTRAKVKGVTQYFDPLNIAKMLTFGSALGPALLGHFMKRDPKDIQYFTGRLKPIREREDTASKISRVSGGEGFSAEANATLHKIYNLLSMTHEESVKRRELAKNREEEHMMEDERRHKELIQALGGRVTATPVTTNVQVNGINEEQTKGLLSSIMGVVFGIIPFIKRMIEGKLEIVTNWISTAFNALKKDIIPWTMSLISTLKSTFVRIFFGLRGLVVSLAGILMNPVVIAGILGAYAAYKLNKWAGTTLEGLTTQLRRNESEITSLRSQLQSINKYTVGREGDDNYINPEWKNKNNLLQRKLIERKKLQDKYEVISNEPQEENESSFFDDLMKLKQVVTGEDVNASLKDISFENTATAISTMPDLTDTPEDRQLEEMMKGVTPAPQPEYVPESSSSKLNDKIDENIENRVSYYAQKSNPEPIINNNTITQQSTQQAAQKREVPSVRNQEPTLQALNYINTVVIG